MNPVRVISFAFLLLLIIAAASWFFLALIPNIEIKTNTDIPHHRFTDLTMQQFDKTGSIEYVLKTKDSHQLAGSETHYIHTPHVHIIKANQPDIIIDAKEALVLSKASQIKLQHDVIIQHMAYKNEAPGVIKTDSLNYFPKKKSASTKDKITWEQANNYIEATGLFANLISEEIELLHDISGHYKTEKEGLIHFKTGHALLNKSNHTGFFSNNVSIDSNQGHLRAEKASLLTDNAGHLTKATATGNPHKKAHAWMAKLGDKPLTHARANTLIYDPLQNKLNLIGDANITQAGAILNAPEICYNVKSGTLSTIHKNNQRTEFIMDISQVPQSKKVLSAIKHE